MKNAIHSSLQKSISYSEYIALFETVVNEGKTTGPNQSEGYVSYTKLNWSRLNRTAQNTELTQETIERLQNISTPTTLLVITEAWCGDASQSLPVIEKIAAISPFLNLRLVLRDENKELMSHFLTNCSESIPKVIILDEQNHVIDNWGPRPTELQNNVRQFKAENPTATGMDISKLTQNWYTKDKGLSTQTEITTLLEEITVSA